VQDEVDDAEVKRVQADAFLRKPFEASQLLATVKPLVASAAGDRGAAPGAGTRSRRESRPIAPELPSVPIVALIDPEQVRAAVTLALDASLERLVDEVTEKVLFALASKR
jgi:hypothetical protein